MDLICNVLLIVVSLSESIDKFERRLSLVWFFSKGGFGKDDLRGREGGFRGSIYGQQTCLLKVVF